VSKSFEKVCRFIERHSMLDRTRAVVVAVSGGADSIALLDILVRLCAAENPFRIHVAHLNHMLRGEEATMDAEFVRAVAERLNLPGTIESTDVRQAAMASGRSIEEAAREARYNFLLAVAREAGADTVATGHTMNDQAETFLMRLARGAGPRGLASMRPVSAVPAYDAETLFDDAGTRGRGDAGTESFDKCETEPVIFSGPKFAASPRLRVPASPQLVRPLLCLTREEVEDYCRERGLMYRTDASNASLDYTRNRVRHEVVAALKQINPRVIEHISSAAEIIASEQEALDTLTHSLLDQAQQPSSRTAYRVAAFVEQPPALRRRMIIEAIRRERSSTGRGEIESKHVTAVERLLDERMSGASLHLPGGLEAWREFDHLVFRHRAEIEEQVGERALDAGCSRIEAGGIEMTIDRGRPGQLLQASLDEARREAVRLGRDWTIVVLDARLLPETLVVRARRKGERARVCGQRKIKKLKNLMIDHKIPSSRRAIWPIVATPDGRYIWSPGMPPAVEFAARDETQTLAILRASGF
jgi:tRNA(Ile)-lysidine synthase